MPQLKGKINEEAFMATSLAEVQFLPLQENDVLDLGGLSLEVIGDSRTQSGIGCFL